MKLITASRRALIAMAFLGLVMIVSEDSRSQARGLPPLLRNTTAGSGWGSACPPRTDQERQFIATAKKLAVSPELEQRLNDAFPPGSDDANLIAALKIQGFMIVIPCDTDPSIEQASFFQQGSGLLSYSTSATVFWKSDEKHHIVWTKGFVWHTGL